MKQQKHDKKKLSIITVGGNKALAAFLMIVFFMLSSCGDVGYLVPFENSSSPQLSIKSGTGLVRVSCTNLDGLYILSFNLKGTYELYPDSLKVLFNDDGIVLTEAIPHSGTTIYKEKKYVVEDRLVSIDVKYNYKKPQKKSDCPMVMYVIPSKFLISNGKPAITDTIKVLMK